MFTIVSVPYAQVLVQPMFLGGLALNVGSSQHPGHAPGRVFDASKKGSLHLTAGNVFETKMSVGS